MADLTGDSSGRRRSRILQEHSSCSLWDERSRVLPDRQKGEVIRGKGHRARKPAADWRGAMPSQDVIDKRIE